MISIHLLLLTGVGSTGEGHFEVSKNMLLCRRETWVQASASMDIGLPGRASSNVIAAARDKLAEREDAAGRRDHQHDDREHDVDGE